MAKAAAEARANSYWNWLARPVLYTTCTLAGFALVGFGVNGLIDFYASLYKPTTGARELDK